MKTRFFAMSLALIIILALSSAGLPHSAQALQATQRATVAPLSKPIRIAIIMPSAKNDLAWSQAIYDSLVAVQKEFGGPNMVKLTVIENMFMVPDAAANAQKFASEGYDIVIMHGTQYGASMFDVAAKFPDVSFAWGTSQDVGADKGLKNIFAYEARAEEGGYVFGVMAAMLTKTNILGVVGPINAGDAKLYIDGFEQGAKATNSKVEVKKIFTDSFGDIAKATQAAKTLISQKADILTGSAQQVPGAITETQKAKLIWFSTDTDQSIKWPNTVAASMVYDWRAMLEDMISSRAAGTKGGKAYAISLKNGQLNLVFNAKVKVSDEVMKAAKDAMQKIMDGTIIVVGSPEAEASATPGAEASPAATESK
jgi:basic membrane protein A and related proteins